MATDPNRDLLISYSTLRKTVGILGLALPFVLWFGSLFIGGCGELQLSISNFYHTRMGDVFVGTLCAISLFLFAYKGHERIDGIMGNIAGVLGICVAIFPTTLKTNVDGLVVDCNITRSVTNPEWIGTFHLVCAGLFLLVLAYFSIKLFTKNRPGEEPGVQKRKRNRVYRICGWIMVACVVACALFFFVLSDETKDKLLTYKPIFWLETISLLAFGFSWLVKGETLWKDK